MKVRLLTPARKEFLEAATFYESEAVGLGADFIDEFECAVSLMTSNHELGLPYEVGTRRVLLRRFPFQIIYEVHSDHLLIVAVAHQKRMPGYWRDRLR